MSTYTVFPFKASGVAPSVYWIEQGDDVLAAAEGLRLLADHKSAVRVTVWRGEALVFSGPSAACAAWLANEPQRLSDCPAIFDPEQLCSKECGRLRLDVSERS